MKPRGKYLENKVQQVHMTSESEKTLPTYRILGSSGLRVSPLCLGCMHFGSKWKGHGIHMDEKEAEKVLKCYYEGGGNFLDTACNYQFGESERMIGRLIKKTGINRDNLVIATKFSSAGMESGDRKYSPNMVGNHSKSMLYHVNKSLENMQLDYIDVLYVHWYSWNVEPKCLMKQLDDLVRSGKVLHVAVSNTPAWIVSACQERADLLGQHRFCAYQAKYSLIDRAIEHDLVPMCKNYKLGIVPWGVVGGGTLAGKRKTEDLVRKTPGWVPEIDEKVSKIQDLLVQIGKSKTNVSASEDDEEEEDGEGGGGVSAANVAMNWAMHRPGVTSVLVGSRSLKQMKDTMKCLHYKLTNEEIAKLDEITSGLPPKVYPSNIVGTGFDTCTPYDFPTKRCFEME